MIFGVPVQELLAFVLMGLGLVFLIGSAIGMLRLPDFTVGCTPPGTAKLWARP